MHEAVAPPHEQLCFEEKAKWPARKSAPDISTYYSQVPDLFISPQFDGGELWCPALLHTLIRELLSRNGAWSRS